MKTAARVLVLALAASAAQAGGFTLASADIAPGATIANHFVYKGFGCSGDNVSPALAWSGAPAGTKSFVLLVHDPDAPTGGAGWWHWIVYDIPATATGLAQGAGTADGAKLPAGSHQASTDFGAPGWGGPCPPVGHGKHHYNFRLYALKVAKLDVGAGAGAALVGYMANANAIGQASFTGLYSR